MESLGHSCKSLEDNQLLVLCLNLLLDFVGNSSQACLFQSLVHTLHNVDTPLYCQLFLRWNLSANCWRIWWSFFPFWKPGNFKRQKWFNKFRGSIFYSKMTINLSSRGQSPHLWNQSINQSVNYYIRKSCFLLGHVSLP